MPLPFTNVWDTTVPLDSDEVNQGASDFRTLRTDVQQRMAAISGTDAAKPDFSADAQPTQWAGILYFATDTNRVYQWSGAFWTDVTSGIGSGGGGGGVSFGVDLTGTSTAQYVVGISGQPLPSLVPGYLHWNGTVWVFDGGGSAALDKNTLGPTVANSTTETTVFTTHVPALSANAILRVTTNIVMDVIVTPSTFFWRLNGTVLKQETYTGPNSTPPSGLIGSTLAYQLFISNRGATNNQNVALTLSTMIGTSAFGLGTSNATGADVDTSVPSVLTLSVQDAATGNSQAFNLWFVELL